VVAIKVKLVINSVEDTLLNSKMLLRFPVQIIKSAYTRMIRSKTTRSLKRY